MTNKSPVYDSEKIRLRTLSRGISAKLFNERVKERYADNQSLLDTCLIRDYDTIPEILLKKITFFFTLENYTPIVEEKIYMRNKPKKGSNEQANTPWLILHFKFKERYIKDRSTGELKPLGQRRMTCFNVDIGKIDKNSLKQAFDGFTFYYGDTWIGYNFTNNREIKLKHSESKEKAIELIEKLNQFTIKDYQPEGKIEDNIFNLSVPKNSPKPDNYNLTGHLFKITIHQKESNKIKKILSVMIQNKVKNKNI